MSTTTLDAAMAAKRFDRARVVNALDALARDDPSPETSLAVRQFGEAMLAGVFGGRPSAEILERCVRLLARTPDLAALPFYRGCCALELPVPHGDAASELRGLALVALHGVDREGARFVATRVLLTVRNNSGQPARSALSVFGAAGNDVALVLACNTALRDDMALQVAALQEMSGDVPADAFWSVAAAMLGDRFADVVLAVTDLIVERRRGDLLPGFAAGVTALSDPDLLRAVLLSLLGARLDGVDAVFAAAVEGCPSRALPGIEEALMLARIENQDALLGRLSERSRRGG